MSNPVRPSLDAGEVWEALASIADGPVNAGEARAALVSALALRHTPLPGATPAAAGARVLPFPPRPARAIAPRARKAPVVPLARARAAIGPPAAAAPAGGTRPATPSDDAIRLVPAPGSVPGLDEGPVRLTVFRSLDRGRVLGREVGAGARVLVSRREAGPLDLAVYATRRTIGLCPAGAPPPGGRILGTVEAVIA